MITIIYSTHKDSNYNNNFKSHLIKTIGVKDFQILEFENFNQYSLSELYNKGINESKNDIIVCLHNDIKLENNWGKKLLKDFDTNPDYGIIGKAGSCYFPSSGIYWEKMGQTMVGQVYHHPPGQKKWLSQYSTKMPNLIPVVTIDGLFISFNKNKVNHFFDETIGKFHFYDHLFCVPNYLSGVKIGVTTSFEITHESVGQPNQEFWESKEKFIEKWGDKLPLDLKPEFPLVEEIKEKVIKNVGKVAVIIPTKGKVNMLYDCVNSFYTNCNSDLFEIFIADTGSTEEEKEWIKQNIITLGNVHLIEYDYYNFAKINNDVVKNHVNDNFTFLLFCNNDIKLLNNVLYEMLFIFKEKSNVGTVGARLHFEDNTIQHNGIVLFLDKEKNIQISHLGLRGYYNFSRSTIESIGNTAALMMIRKNVFLKCNMFNETYLNCFEDVELNFQCVTMGLKNYVSGKSVAYHYESQSRNEDKNKMSEVISDYRERLYPYITKNINKLVPYIKSL